MNAVTVYAGSDGDQTIALYESLTNKGPIGLVAKCLFRASKSSSRAKQYRGGNGRQSYRSMAYETKEQSLKVLCAILKTHADKLGITWGWKKDPGQEYHNWVVYVDLSNGQVSFHGASRGDGPDYAGDWDGLKVSTERIVQFCDAVLLLPDAEIPADDPIISFGKHAGKRVSEIEIDYLSWLVKQPWLKPELKRAIEAKFQAAEVPSGG